MNLVEKRMGGRMTAAALLLLPLLAAVSGYSDNAVERKAVPAAGTAAPPVEAVRYDGLLQVKTLCVPVVSSRTFERGLAPNPRGGWSFVGQFMNYRSTGDKEKESRALPGNRHYLAYTDLAARPEAEWVIADLATGKAKTVRWPGFHALNVGAVLAGNGRLFFSVDYGHIYYYDPVEDTVKPLGRLLDNLEELRLFYKLMAGPDGMIYGTAQTTVGTTTLLRLNPDTLEYRLYRGVGLKDRREDLTYGYYLAPDPPWVYVAVGQGNWELFAVNMDTDERRCLVNVIGDGTRIVCTRGAEYCEAEVIQPGLPKAKLWLVDGQALPVDPAGHKPESAPFAERRYPPIVWTATQPMDLAGRPEVNPEWPVAIDRHGRAEVQWRPAGVTGAWRRLFFSIKNAEPVNLESLIALPDGSLFGNASSYNGFFRYDPATAKLEFFGKFPPSRPALALADGKVYFAGYPNTMLLRYDPALPWNASELSRGAGTNDNPRLLGKLGQGCAEAHYARKLLDGGNGRLYLLGLRERWSTGTGLGYYEPTSGIFFGLGTANKDLEPMGLVVVPRSGRIICSGKPSKGGDARLIVYDMDLREVERLELRAGLTEGGELFPSADAGQFLGCVAGPETNRVMLYRYDLATRRIVCAVEVPAKIEEVFVRSSDGAWWALAAEALFRLDPHTLALTPAGRLEGGLSHPVWTKTGLYGVRGGALVRVILP